MNVIASRMIMSIKSNHGGWLRAVVSRYVNLRYPDFPTSATSEINPTESYNMPQIHVWKMSEVNTRLFLLESAAYEDDNTLGLSLVLSVLQGKLRYLRTFAKIDSTLKSDTCHRFQDFP
jgi:hypothetical protein